MTNWQITWSAGPDAGAVRVVAPGRYVVGRAAGAPLRCDDPALEPFHAVLHCTADGTWQVDQLTGRLPVRVNGGTIELGCSVLTLAPTQSVPTEQGGGGGGPVDLRRGAVVRVPRVVPQWTPAPQPEAAHPWAGVGAPRRFGGSPSMVISTVTGLVGAMVMAMVFHQPMMMAFAALGALASVGTMMAHWLSARRQRRDDGRRREQMLRQAEAAEAELRRAWRAYLDHTVGSLPGTLHSNERWQRRAQHGDAFTLALGIGEGTLAMPGETAGECSGEHPMAPERLTDVPVGVDLGPGAVVGVAGGHAPHVVRSLIVQLAMRTGPADWRLVVVPSDPAAWEWVRHLPHGRDADGLPAVVDDAGLAAYATSLQRLTQASGSGCPHLVVVTDRLDLLAVRTGPLRRLMASSVNPAVLCLVDESRAAPAVCTAMVETLADGRARWRPRVHHDDAPFTLRFAGLGASAAEQWARSLALLDDPEDELAQQRRLPRQVSLLEVLTETERAVGFEPSTPASLAASVEDRWRHCSPDAAPATPIGRAADGVVDICLVRDGPHALVAGTTGSGKSELLRSLVTGLAVCLPPDHVSMVLIDYKGGATFDVCAPLPHVVGIVTDLDERLAERALRSLRAELTHRERVLRDLGAVDLTDARRRCGAPVMPRLVVVVDEFAALAVELPAFLHSLVHIAQRGRSLGVHLILATQRPSGVIDDEIRANTNLRVALRMHDRADAVDVVGDASPAELGRAVPGRAVMRLGPDERVTFQVASGGIEQLVAAVVQASTALGCSPQRTPWHPPLPGALLSGDLTAMAAELGAVGESSAVGVVDLPDEQRREALRWAPADGDLLVVGSPGSGVTSTLRTVAMVAACAAADSMELLVVDAHGDRRWDVVAAHPRCAGVVRLHERERLIRLLQRAVCDDVAPGQRVVVIDGIGALHRELGELDRMAEADLWQRLITGTAGQHGAGGARLVVGSDGASAVPAAVLARCATRWVMHLHDARDASTYGVPMALAAPAVAGRLVVAGRGVEAQVVHPADAPHTADGAERLDHHRLPSMRAMPPVAPLAVLPTTIDGSLLPRGEQVDGGWRFAWGIGFVDLAPVMVEVSDGDHLLVAGPAGSGTSSALARIAEAWVGTPTGERGEPASWSVFAPRRSPLRALSAATFDVALAAAERAVDDGRPHLLVVDDADLVPDLSGRLAALLAARPQGLVVAAGGRAEALRQAYGHWTTALRRGRLGSIATASSDLDGDLLGVVLPRRLPIPARAGLAHVVSGGSCVLAQLALAQPQPVRLPVSSPGPSPGPSPVCSPVKVAARQSVVVS